MLLQTFDQSRIWDPLQEVSRIREEIGRLFRERAGAAAYPAVNLWTGEKEAVITAEVPGVELKDIELSVQGEFLNLKVNRPAPELSEGQALHRQERSAGSFARTLTLPFQVDAEKVQAKYAHGVLSVVLPKSAAEFPKKIEVKSS
jgi:HSP20 family protein